MEPISIVLTTLGWLISSIIGKAVTALLEAWANRVGLGNEYLKLKKELTLLQALVRSSQLIQTENEHLRELLNNLKQLAYEAEDLLDELDYYRIQDDVELSDDTSAASINKENSSTSSSAATSSSGFRLASHAVLSALKQVSCSCSCSSSRDAMVHLSRTFAPRINMSSRMTELANKLQQNREDVDGALKTETSAITAARDNLANQALRTNPRQTTAYSNERVFGRDEEQERLVELLVNDKTAGVSFSVITLHGAGGIGKTTLARSIYHDQRVKKHFELQMWITVSVDFNSVRLTREMLQHFPDARYDNITNLNVLQQTLVEKLSSKRCLLVLDDMWEDKKKSEWESLLAPLGHSPVKGNVVLVTTRNQSVARMVSTTDLVISLDGLKREEFWSFFKLCTFGNENCKEHHRLEETGREIVEKLKCNPLAAKTVGGLLKENLEEWHWRKVLESEQWKSQQDGDSIMPALRLSYEYLPFHLQQCFSYCALFPKDYHFKREELVHIWMAQGFIVDSMIVEDTGSKNLNNLIDRGFFEEVYENNYCYYLIHDLMHDLAQMVSLKECLSVDGSESILIQPTIRHLSIIPRCTRSTYNSIETRDDVVLGRKFETQLDKVGTSLRTENLRTVMFMGETEETFRDTLMRYQSRFRVAKGLRLVRSPKILDLQSLVHDFTNLCTFGI